MSTYYLLKETERDHGNTTNKIVAIVPEQDVGMILSVVKPSENPNWRMNEFGASYELGEAKNADLYEGIKTGQYIAWPIEKSTQHLLIKIKSKETTEYNKCRTVVIKGETCFGEVTVEILSANCPIVVPKFDKDGKVFWYISSQVYLIDTPTITEPTKVSFLEDTWLATLEWNRVVNLSDELGEEYKEYLAENNFAALCYKEKCPADSYYCLLDGKFTHLYKQDFEDNLKSWKKNKNKVKVEINGRTVIFESAEDAKKVLGS